MKATEFITEFYDPAMDNTVKYDYDDTRRPRLTLYKISKLRKMRDTERVDNKQYLDFLPSMYGNTDDGQEGMM